MKRIILTFFAVVLIAVSCKKDKEDTTAININNIAGKYKIIARDFKEGIGTYDILAACEKDDIITLDKNKSYTWPDAGTKCSPTFDVNGAWDLPSQTKFTIDNIGFEDSWDLKTFDGKILEISQSGIDTFQAFFNSGQTFTLSYKFQKQ
jgi:hypothetical protein